MNRETCLQVIGGLTKTTKMPCYSMSLPAQYCKNGAKYRLDPCSICHYCFAYERNNYTWPTVKNAQQRRYAKLLDVLTSTDNRAIEYYIDSFVFLLKGQKFFRWQDSGDIINAKHLSIICTVCANTPNCNHRLPTKEVESVQNYLSLGKTIPSNLNIQVSSPLLNIKTERIHNLQIATCYRDAASAHEADGFTCPATIPNGIHKCGDCRKCWDNSTDINYILH